MKLIKSYQIFILLIFLMSCSYIKIINPPPAQVKVGSPHDLVVVHTGCGSPISNSLTVYLDKDTENEIDISSSFTYAGGRWIAENYPIPIGQHTLTIHADVHTHGWCFESQSGDTHNFTVMEDCPPDSYCSYFLDNPVIADATIHTLDQPALSYFWEYIVELEDSGFISIDEPVESVNCVEPDDCYSIHLTDVEKKRIHAAKMAHSVWLDKNSMLPWKLKYFTQEEFHCLFDPQKLFDSYSIATPDEPHDYFISVVDYSPSDIYQYVLDNDLIRSSQYETMWAVLDNLRTTDTQRSFIHGAESYGDPLNTSYTLSSALTNWSDRGYGSFRISRSGCHSMARIVVGLLRSINIAGEVVAGGQWMSNFHASAVWPGVYRVLPHGDDIYTATLRAVPSSLLLPQIDFYSRDENIAVCGTDVDCISRRHKALMAVQYPDDYTLERCCDPEPYGYPDCRAYLTAQYGEFLTEDEIDIGVDNIESLCP